MRKTLGAAGQRRGKIDSRQMQEYVEGVVLSGEGGGRKIRSELRGQRQRQRQYQYQYQLPVAVPDQSCLVLEGGGGSVTWGMGHA